jgi:hypothetical protein
MKYSVSSRQQPEYLQKCDEIKVMWNDRNIIFDLTEKYPGKTINLCRYLIHSNEDDIDWSEIKKFKTLARDNFVFGLTYINEIIECKAHDIEFYYLEPIRSFRELQGLKLFGAKWAFIDAPLFFQMDKVRAVGLPVRVTANISVREAFPYADGVPGPWIRPEDVEAYEPYVDTIEFSRVNLDQERALFRIYAEQKKWPGELGLIVQDINYLGTNRMIPPDLVEKRLNCGQKCMENGNCRLCWRILDLANPDLLRDYQKATQ